MRYPYQNEAAAPEGTSGGAAAVQPTVTSPPVVDAAAAKTPTPVVPVPQVAVAPVVTAKAEPAAPEPKKPDAAPAPALDLAAKLAELEAARAKDAEKIAQLEAARVADTKALRDAKLDGLLDRVKVAPPYRDFARSQLAAIDPDATDGKAAVDMFASTHPAMLDLPKTGQPEPTVAGWIAEKAKTNPGSAWAFMPPSALAKLSVD